jgi:hypothetical protein
LGEDSILRDDSLFEDRARSLEESFGGESLLETIGFSTASDISAKLIFLTNDLSYIGLCNSNFGLDNFYLLNIGVGILAIAAREFYACFSIVLNLALFINLSTGVNCFMIGGDRLDLDL